MKLCRFSPKSGGKFSHVSRCCINKNAQHQMLSKTRKMNSCNRPKKNGSPKHPKFGSGCEGQFDDDQNWRSAYRMRIPLRMLPYLLMVQKSGVHQLICRISHYLNYLHAFIHPRWCRISSINTISTKMR